MRFIADYIGVLLVVFPCLSVFVLKTKFAGGV